MANLSSSVPGLSAAQVERGYGSNGINTETSQLGQSMPQPGGRFTEAWDASQRGSSLIDGSQMRRVDSVASNGDARPLSRGGTLKKKGSVKRGSSLRRSSSRRSSRAGSVRSLALQTPADVDDVRSAFYSPVPTTGNPTEILANRFQAWRKVLKDLIAYFKELQLHYEHRGKSLLKVANVINNTTPPTMLLSSGGIDDALQLFRAHHSKSIEDCTKAKSIQNDVILQLVGLRSDLQQKIKEIKNLSGDFKNSVDKEMDSTRKAVKLLQEALGHSDIDPSQSSGSKDPYLLRLAADRQLERQIDEENYLHQAYLNLEASGRELEVIVVGEIQKSYNAFAAIMRREADDIYATMEDLRAGPLGMPKDREWDAFVERDERFVDPRVAVRDAQHLHYPGRDNELATEVRAGLLERKSKYLKSYTPGWFVLTPTHIHEFKSADKNQMPFMSLYLPDQKLGSHSQAGGGSKFMLKGRQTGSMHARHSWIFRAESHETMMAWYEDIKKLTESSPTERNEYVRQHARSISGNSQRAASVASSDGVDDDDEEPFSTTASAVVASTSRDDGPPRRPNAGGRFPSDLVVNTNRGLQAPLSPSSGSSADNATVSANQDHDRDAIAAASALPGSGIGENYGDETLSSPTHAAMVNEQAEALGVNPYTSEPFDTNSQVATGNHTGTQAVFLNSSMPPLREEQIIQDNSIAQGPPQTQTTWDILRAAQDDDPASINAQNVSGFSSASTTVALTDLSNVDHVTSNPIRPTLNSTGQTQESVRSISQLHVPGEYPRTSSLKNASEANAGSLTEFPTETGHPGTTGV